MDREDAQKSIERHATSKLRALADLQQIETHGFRGEALPSIASVSHLLLRTRDTSAAGTEVELRHGRLSHVKDAGHPRGTTVEVRDLFGAVPARRKFLRSDATEASHVSEAVTLLALARPETGFVLKSGGRLVLEAPPTDSMAARLYQIFGGRQRPGSGGRCKAERSGRGCPASSRGRSGRRPVGHPSGSGSTGVPCGIERCRRRFSRRIVPTGLRRSASRGVLVPRRSVPPGRRQRASRQERGALRGPARRVRGGAARRARGAVDRERGVAPTVADRPRSGGDRGLPGAAGLFCSNKLLSPSCCGASLDRDQQSLRRSRAHRARPAPQHLHRRDRWRGPVARGPAHGSRARAFRGAAGARRRPRARVAASAVAACGGSRAAAEARPRGL